MKNQASSMPNTDYQKLILDNESKLSISHQQVIQQKQILLKIYKIWYKMIKQKLDDCGEGLQVEVGSGGGFIKEIIPDTITSDILPLPHIDMAFDATSIPFADSSLKAIMMINVFHHISDCSAFLAEAQRTLKSGGKVIMIEPSNCLWSKLIYQNLHHEPFEPSVINWQFESKGPLSSSNQALPYIVFERDRQIFNKRFPLLKVKSIHFHTPLLYLLSGGLSKPSLIPSFLEEMAIKLDKFVSNQNFHMFSLIELEKL